MESIEGALDYWREILRLKPLEEELESAPGDQTTSDSLQNVEQLHHLVFACWHLFELISADSEKSMDLRCELL